MLDTDIMNQHTGLPDKVGVRPRHPEIIHPELTESSSDILHRLRLPILRQQLRATPQFPRFLPPFTNDPELVFRRNGDFIIKNRVLIPFHLKFRIIEVVFN